MLLLLFFISSLMGMDNEVKCCTLDPQGNVITGLENGSMRIHKDHEYSTFKTDGTDPITSLAFSPDCYGNSYLFSGDRQGILREYEYPSLKLIRKREAHIGYVKKIVPINGIYSMSAGVQDIKLWNACSGYPQDILIHRKNKLGIINELLYAEKIKKCISAGSNGFIKITKVKNDRLSKVHTLPEIYQMYLHIALAEDQKKLFSACNNGYHVSQWDIGTGKKELVFIDKANYVDLIALSLDSKYLMAAYRGDDFVRIWDIGQQKLVALLKHHNEVKQILMNEKYLILGMENSVVLFDAAMGFETRKIITPSDANNSKIHKLLLKGNALIICCSDGTIDYYDIE